eukprot:scpid7369/ scgid2846/ 
MAAGKLLWLSSALAFSGLLPALVSTQATTANTCDSSALTFDKVSQEVLQHLPPSGDVFQSGPPDIAYNCIAYGRNPSRIKEAVITGTMGLGYEVVTLHYRCHEATGKVNVVRVPTFLPSLHNATVDCAACNPLAADMCEGKTFGAGFLLFARVCQGN